jgi:hypothetical protein
VAKESLELSAGCVDGVLFGPGMRRQMNLTMERRQEIFGRIPMRPFVQIEEIATQVAWLCSDDCSFATGAVFDLSGGRAIRWSGIHDPAKAARKRHTRQKRVFAEHGLLRHRRGMR